MAKRTLVWNTSPKTLAAKLTSVPQGLEDEITHIIEELVLEGKNIMVNNIETRGTGYVGNGRAPQSDKEAGRVNDGVMRAAVQDGMVSDRAGRFGWGIHNQGVPQYFLEQEYDVTVGGNPPMHALTDAWITIREQYKMRVKHLLTGRGWN